MSFTVGKNPWTKPLNRIINFTTAHRICLDLLSTSLHLIYLSTDYLRYIVFVAGEQFGREDWDTEEPPGPEDQPGAAAQRAHHCKGPCLARTFICWSTTTTPVQKVTLTRSVTSSSSSNPAVVGFYTVYQDPTDYAASDPPSSSYFSKIPTSCHDSSLLTALWGPVCLI